MGTGQEAGAQSHQRLKQDHQGLMERVRAIERFRPTRDDIGAEWAAAVAGELETLVGELATHFRWEEQNELFTSFSEEFPSLCGTIDRLRGQHQEILGELQALLGHCKQGRGGAQGTKLCDQLLAALAKLRQHEADESDIVRRAYQKDSGPRE